MYLCMSERHLCGRGQYSVIESQREIEIDKGRKRKRERERKRLKQFMYHLLYRLLYYII